MCYKNLYVLRFYSLTFCLLTYLLTVNFFRHDITPCPVVYKLIISSLISMRQLKHSWLCVIVAVCADDWNAVGSADAVMRWEWTAGCWWLHSTLEVKHLDAGRRPTLPSSLFVTTTNRINCHQSAAIHSRIRLWTPLDDYYDNSDRYGSNLINNIQW